MTFDNFVVVPNSDDGHQILCQRACFVTRNYAHLPCKNNKQVQIKYQLLSN